ncbi:hypothetical protein [Caballeronia sp. LZ032]|uniref:hypothetical protein n=1 Tax=Caballeronia sp. LZ032 TaxID=3038565 RepID=UPI00285C2F2B|nr:hypothetical protein [Caballeronia sp. LZ032]MDR5880859.1 hypothetical protein [Caballeronia sp. LZ032]
MDARTIQQLYLRAIYSGLPEPTGLEEEVFVARHHSEERAAIERAARTRNLRTVLHDDMRLLPRVLDKTRLLPYVERYTESECFWMHRGRTLIEDFSLFLVERTPAPAAIKVLARIEGVHSGLSASVGANTPWSAHVKWREEDEVVERFRSPFALSFRKMFADSSGYEPELREVDCVIRRSPHRIQVKFHSVSICE